MRIPYPERFKWKSVCVFVVLLFIGQLATGTDIYFAGLLAAFVLLWAGAVNRGGGLYYASGAYIFFNGVLLVILDAVWKVFLLEPGESYLRTPNLTMLVYCGGMAAMWAAVYFSKMLTPKRGLLSNYVNENTIMQSAVGCFVVGTLFIVLFGGTQQAGGSFGAAVSETNRFPQFAIMLATAYEIRRSNGRRAWNLLIIVQVALLFGLGVINTSKEGMFLGPVTWIITAVAYRFNFKPKLLLGLGLFTFFMLYYMVPYSQYVRVYRTNGNAAASRATALEYIFKLGEVRSRYQEAGEDTSVYLGGPHFYKESQGLIDRLGAIAMDDTLIEHTNQGFVFGLYPTYHGIINTIPTFIWPSKPKFFTGNEYAREMGILPSDDLSTGISFSPEADAFHQATWFGLLIVMPLVCFCYFLANDSFAGSVKDSPWPLLLVILASHLAPEGGVDSMLLQIVEGSIGIMFMALVIRYVLPLAIRLGTGREKTVVRKGLDFRPRATLRARTQAADAGGTGSDVL